MFNAPRRPPSHGAWRALGSGLRAKGRGRDFMGPTAERPTLWVPSPAGALRRTCSAHGLRLYDLSSRTGRRGPPTVRLRASVGLRPAGVPRGQPLCRRAEIVGARSWAASASACANLQTVGPGGSRPGRRWPSCSHAGSTCGRLYERLEFDGIRSAGSPRTHAGPRAIGTSTRVKHDAYFVARPKTLRPSGSVETPVGLRHAVCRELKDGRSVEPRGRPRTGLNIRYGCTGMPLSTCSRGSGKTGLRGSSSFRCNTWPAVAV
jgi:hypothetical protein